MVEVKVMEVFEISTW